MAAIGFVACTSDETVTSHATSEANEISFRALNNGVTRATSLNLASLQANGFYVTATYTSGHTAYFADQLYKQESSNVWKPYTGEAYTHIYWPTGSDVLDFHAYAPADDDAQLNVSNSNVTTSNGCPEYTVTPHVSASSQIDFIYASLTSKDQADGTLPLNFNHMESQVGIKLSNSDGALKFTVSEVSICNVVRSGIYKNRNASPSTATTMAWEDFGEPRAYAQTGLSITKDGVQSATDAGTTWILIPHALAKPAEGHDGEYAGSAALSTYAGAYIKVKYKCQNKQDNSYYAGGDGDNWVEGIWPISTNASAATWDPGTHYTYTIDLKGGGYYEQNQADTDANLDRILNLNEITFATVTVSDWTPSTSTVTMP